MEKLLTISQAAQILGVSIDTLRQWDKKGLLRPFRPSKTGYRYYREQDLYLFRNNLLDLAERWVGSDIGTVPDPMLYCPTSDIFQNRLVKMQHDLEKIIDLPTPFSLIVASIGEIGNNSFDHNLGNWRDVPGVFFGYDLKKRQIVLADRGQGIFKTLQRVKPEIKNDAEAIRVGFTQIISGRAPEERGNGLKYVKRIVITNPLNFLFESGNAQLSLKKGDQELNISEKNQAFHGCIALLEF